MDLLPANATRGFRSRHREQRRPSSALDNYTLPYFNLHFEG